MAFIIVHGNETIPGIPAGELEGPGTYEIEDGEVVDFIPLGEAFSVAARVNVRRLRRMKVAPPVSPGETVAADTTQVAKNGG